MASRLDLHEKLKSVSGLENVYYQPPESIKLKFPCIVYTKEKPHATYADNKRYRKVNSYTVTVICKDPDNSYADFILDGFEMASPANRFMSDGLYHDPITIYF